MDGVRKLIVLIFGMAVLFGNSILGMILGWGLMPENWGWVIGCSIFGTLFGQLIISISK